MGGPDKMLVVETMTARDVLQASLGPEWLVLTYDQGRVGQRVGLIMFCRPIRAETESQRTRIEESKKYLMHALKPGGVVAFLP